MLKARRLQAGESLVDFANTLQRLAAKAYPAHDPALRDELAKDQFMAGLASVEMRVKVAEADPDTLDDAVRWALRLEAIQEAVREQSRPETLVAAVSSGSQESSNDCPLAAIEWLQLTQEALLSVLTNSDGGRAATPGAAYGERKPSRQREEFQSTRGFADRQGSTARNQRPGGDVMSWKCKEYGLAR